MRVTARSRDDRGLIAVLVALSMVVFIGMAGVAIDVGNVWRTRRNLVTATDAAALAAAGVYATGGNGCAGAAGTYFNANISGGNVVSCTPTVSGGTGSVTVVGNRSLSLLFAPAVSAFTSTDVASSTTARWGQPTGVSGMRPFALCTQVPELAPWTDRTQPFGPVRITYAKSSASACGSAPGNWGILDFNGGSNSNSDTVSWVQNGYPGTVTAPSWIDGDTGAFSNSLPLASIVGQTIYIPMFDSTNLAGGSNAQFHVVGFARIILHGFRDTGSQANRYLEIEFLPGIVQGTCCGSSTIDTGLRVVVICGIDDRRFCS